MTIGHAVRTLGTERSYWILVAYFTLMGIAGLNQGMNHQSIPSCKDFIVFKGSGALAADIK